MEKRSRQRVRDQVAHMAFGAESRIRARADIHDGQELKGSINRPDTEALDQPSPNHHFRLATRGRSIQLGHELPRHFTGSAAEIPPESRHAGRPLARLLRATNGLLHCKNSMALPNTFEL